MAWHKQKEYDPTEAFLANNKQQQLLELRLKDIDKLWFARLKYYAKDRLETTAELMRLTEDKRHLDHFNKSLKPEELKLYTHHMGNVMKLTHKELTSDNFDFDKYKRRRNSVIVPSRGVATSLPRIEKHNTEVDFRLKRREPMITKTDIKDGHNSRKNSLRRSSGTGISSLQSSRFISMSDTDLYKKRKDSKASKKNEPLTRAASDLEQRLKTDLYKKSKDFKHSKLDLESILRVADVNSPEAVGKKRPKSKNNRKLPLLAPKKLVVTKDDHRYLKHRMETTILPPLSEDTQKRKMSC